MKLRAPLAGFALAAALFGCGDDDIAQPSATPTAVSETPTPTNTPTPEPSPTPVATPTPLPGCQPLSTDGGFPVVIGGVSGQPCVIWRGPSPARVVVEEGAFATEEPPTRVTTFDVVSSPFTFPPGVLPGIRTDRPCFDRDGGFRVRVESPVGLLIGSEERYTCSRIVTLADGCRVGSPGRDTFGLGKLPGGAPGEPAACIVWPDRFSNETGFRIELAYPNSGEKFTYLVGPNTIEFVPPEPDTRGVGSFATGLGRKDWDIRVFAITPEGDKLVDSQSVQVM